MEMNDSRRIAAPAADVWAALFDPAVLQACVPGCEELTGSAHEGFEAAVVQKVGPVKARFKGVVSLSDIVEGESCTLSGEGKGGAAGFAKGAAKLRLEAQGETETILHYAVEAKVGGKLAQLGSRIIDGFARKMADDFFARFQAKVEGSANPDALATDAPGAAAADPDDAPTKKGWIKRIIG